MSRLSCFFSKTTPKKPNFFLNVRLIFFLIAISTPCFGINLVRDAEIEEYLYEISSPIFASAGVKSESINFYIVNDSSINAFVYGGQNIFVNTGLIQHSQTPNMLQGVIAHELGHIMGVHLIKMQPQMSKALAIYALATLLGVGILATDSSMSGSNAAIASTILGQHIAERQFLSFSRTQESEADRYALKYLKKSEIPTEGMLQLFNKLENMQKLYVKEIDKYSVTHPLSKERYSYFQNNAVQGKEPSTQTLEKHRFIQAKILAYSPTKNLYTNSNEIISHPQYSLYYLAYKNILENQPTTALKYTKQLIQLHPNNPYFYETASVIYQKLQNYSLAKKNFSKAVELSPNNLFLQHEYASFVIKASKNKIDIQNAIFILEKLKNSKESSPILYKNLQFAYKNLHMEEHYLISLIEEFALFEDTKIFENKEKLNKMIENLEKTLKSKPNPNISQRLKRIKKLIS